MKRLPGAGSLGGRSGGGGGGKGTDSLGHRTGLEDSITITYRFLDTSRYRKFDSSISDFTTRFPIPADYAFLGNTGNAAHSLIFNPVKTTGWDPGFHAFDIYQYNIPETRFFSTTRPYSEIGYVLGSRTEQLINILHTQNVTPDWNVAFQYRLINAPGAFKNQNTNHNNYRLNSFYQSKNRRYHAFFIVVNNKIQSAENGGILGDQDYLDDVKSYANRLLVPVQLGNNVGSTASVFSSTINTGTKYKNFTFMWRHQYDLGRKDSIVTDSTVIPLFYPKFRLEHTFRTTSYTYSFVDLAEASQNADSGFYRRNYGFLQNPTMLTVQDKWNELVNDVSIYQFPDEKNAQQFIKVGGSLQNLKGVFDVGTKQFYNMFIHGEYRNKTRNQKWDIEANGQLYLAGSSAGDYSALISLKRYISKQIGYFQAGFQNVNRTPSFIFDNASSFNFDGSSSFNKENITSIFGTIEQPQRRLKLSGTYNLITNYTYFRDYYHADQSSALFNLLQITLDKEFRVGRLWRWYTQATVQQKAGAAPVNVPLVYTRNRFGYDGSLGFKNLHFLFGTEIKYYTPYKADGYSPLLGQFYYQNAQTISLKMPEIALYVTFRIKSFNAYVRGENLNSLRIKEQFGFTNNNLAAPLYPYQGLQIRLGIFWSFVN
ncbi:MAG: putative porin [Chitinophagaceae bacterium]